MFKKQKVTIISMALMAFILAPALTDTLAFPTAATNSANVLSPSTLPITFSQIPPASTQLNQAPPKDTKIDSENTTNNKNKIPTNDNGNIIHQNGLPSNNDHKYFFFGEEPKR
jgi:hypothetical protein